MFRGTAHIGGRYEPETNLETMQIDIVTKEDLCSMQKEMMEEIRQLVRENVKRENDRQWLRSAEVRKMLGILYQRWPYLPFG